MTELGYLAFDADQHYYEAEDAFIRFMPNVPTNVPTASAAPAISSPNA